MHDSRRGCGIGYPLVVIGETIQTVVGGSVTIAATTFLGHWFGLWIREGRLPDAADTICRIILSLLISVFLFPPFTVAAVLTLVVWFWLLDAENLPLRVGAAAVCLLT